MTWQDVHSVMPPWFSLSAVNISRKFKPLVRLQFEAWFECLEEKSQGHETFSWWRWWKDEMDWQDSHTLLCKKWRIKFQNSPNRVAGGNCMQFTCGMWLDKSRRELPTAQNDSKCQLKQGTFFHTYCGHWICLRNQRRPTRLQFWVCLKPNQQSNPFRSLQNWRLSKLTTIMETNKNLPLLVDKIYPQHFQALQHTGLVTNEKDPNIDQTTATQRRSQSS